MTASPANHPPNPEERMLFEFDCGMPKTQVGDRPDLEQFFTPPCFASLLIERYFPNLGRDDLVIDAGTGRGAFLGEIPREVPALGVEIDPILAEIAAERTGRQVICGDFRVVDIPGRPTAVLGNPPFRAPTVGGFLKRAHALLPDNGRCGFVMAAHSFSYSGPFERWAKDWSIEQEIIPRQLFRRMSVPLVFALFTKERVKRYRGFFLFSEVGAVGNVRPEVKMILMNGGRRKGVWKAVIDEAFRSLGGRATSQQIYEYVAPRRPTDNRFWKDKIRQVLNLGDYEKRGSEWLASAA